jgi:L-glutamine-phosphate cytidylyltransferase
MQAVILAAGCGSRLAPAINSNPKCFTQLEGTRLIEYQLSVLRHFGINDVCVVLGYRADTVRHTLGEDCHYVLNERYAATNSLYSLWLTRHWVQGPFLLMNSDVLAHPQVYWRLLAQPGSALAYDSRSGTEEEHMKAAFADGKLQALSKTLAVEDTQGESIGLLKFDAWAAALLFREAEILLANGGETQWAPAAVERLARQWSIVGVDVADLPWAEIDYPEDLVYARTRVWPLFPKTFTAHLPRHTETLSTSLWSASSFVGGAL